ncbi:MAG: V-type ATP synthase subunit A [Nitrospirota bacterium]
MTGNITGISGPTVSVALKGLRLYERVYVGNAMLMGEVVKIEQDRAVVQVYEDTHGLAPDEPVRGTGMPLSVRLGPGLLSGTFDGLQRPLERLKEESGPFICSGKDVSALDQSLNWTFHPLKNKGDDVSPGEIIGYVKEGRFSHFITCGSGISGRLSWVADGEINIESPAGVLTDGKEIPVYHEWPVRVPRPYRNKTAPSRPLITGQRAIDFLFPFTKGGTAILPGGFGTGKTILEQSIAKFADVDIVVYAGCGERGNEMAEMIEEFKMLKDPWTGSRLMERTILVINTSNMPVAAREASIYTAVTMAEYFRDMGHHVLLLADSISRWAEALREISSSLEEMPGEEGYPTYLSSRLSGFIERAGVVETYSGKTGSLSMVLSVSPPGGDFTEPVTQSCLRTTGTFLMLDTSLAHRRHFPAINWFQSYSLYAGELAAHYKEYVSSEWEEVQKGCRDILRKEEALREVVEIIGIEGIQDQDRLLLHSAEMIRQSFLCQNAYTDDAFSTLEKTLAAVKKILDFFKDAENKLKKGTALSEIITTK